MALSSAKILSPRDGFAVQAAACPWITQASMLWPPGLLKHEWTLKGLIAEGAETVFQF